VTHPNASVALASTVLDELRRHGVSDVVVAPGSRSAALSMSSLSMGFDVHVELDERSAGFYALGLAIGGALPVIVTTSGTAVANLLPALVEADLSNRPLIVLSADRPPELLDRGANQTIEQRGIFGSRVRWEFDPGPAEDRPESNSLWRSMVSRAVAAAVGVTGRPGPVHLNLPFREPLVPATDDGRTAGSRFTSPTVGRPDSRPWSPVPARQVWTLDRVPEPERTLVILGDTAGRVDVDLRDVAFVAEPHSGRRDGHALTGLHHLASHPGAGRWIPDRVVTIGRVGLSRPLSSWLAGVPTTSVDPSGRWLDPTSRAERVVRRAEVPVADAEWLASLRAIDEAIGRAVASEIDDLAEITEPRLARDAARAVPDGGRLIVASSMPVRDLDLFMDVAIPVHSNRGASGIDGFVSTVLGLASTSGGPVVALAGDLSMLHDSNGFLLSERPDCVFVVIDNDGGGIFSFLPQADYPEGFERIFGTPHGRSFERFAEFHGLGFAKVEDPDRIRPTVEAAVQETGISLVVARTDRAANVGVHRRITGVAHAAIDDALNR
jgi:2-succinyl-5-enolpyruvyl-6-hydroxy-3-cyclohexene-1-carboxylate synthase